MKLRAAFTLTLAAALLAAGPMPAPAGAQQASTTLLVHAVVVRNCTVVTTPVDFGNYDPLVANRTQPLDSTGTVTVECTKGVAPAVELDLGQNADGTNRRMAGGAAEFLGYELYADPGHSNIWGTGTQGLSLPSSPGVGGTPAPQMIYGRVAGGQNVAPGDYNDTVNVTVIF